METGTGLTILGSAVGGARLIEKILGPTADYLGEGLRDWTQKKVENVGRIFSKAKDKLGERIESPGAVPAKVLKGILDEGSVCEDELAAEYFAGVLASARTLITRDDRAATYLRLTADLSSYQIRTHYIYYTALKQKFRGIALTAGTRFDNEKMQVYMSNEQYEKAMALNEREDLNLIATHSVTGLDRIGLLDLDTIAEAEHLRDVIPGFHPYLGGIIATPLTFGFEYYMWVHGSGDLPVTSFLTDTFSPHLISGVSIPEVVAG